MPTNLISLMYCTFQACRSVLADIFFVGLHTLFFKKPIFIIDFYVSFRPYFSKTFGAIASLDERAFNPVHSISGNAPLCQFISKKDLNSYLKGDSKLVVAEVYHYLERLGRHSFDPEQVICSTYFTT